MQGFMLLLLSVSLLFPASTPMQESECPTPRFLPGQPVQVIGSVEAGAMPYHAQMGSEYQVLGFIPIGTTLTVQEGPICAEGQNWYGAAVEAEANRVWITDEWLEPLPLFYAGRTGIRLKTQQLGTLTDITYRPEEKAVLLTISQPGNFTYYLLSIETGILTQTADPYVRSELTGKLGITVSSPIQISPDGSRILYFIPEPVRENCAEGCTADQVYVANSDGSDPVLLGHVPSRSVWDVHWGANNRLYLTLVTEAGFQPYLKEFCLDGSCENALYETLDQWGVPEDLYLGYAMGCASVSPNGNYLAVERLLGGANGSLIFDMETWIELPDNGDICLPVRWEDDRTIDYPISVDGSAADQVLRILLDFDQQTYRVLDQRTGDMFEYRVNQWLYAENMFFVRQQDGLGIYCAFNGCPAD